MSHVSQCIVTELNVSVCYYYLNYYFVDNLTQNLPQLCFMLLEDTLTAFDLSRLCYAEVISMDTLHTMVLNYQEEELLGNVVTTSFLRP